MTLSRKFTSLLLSSIFAIAILNIIAISLLYSGFFRLYLSEKIEARKDITLEYINGLIEKQALEDVEWIFSSAEIEFFELLDINEWKIPLSNQKNINIVVDFLSKSWVSAKYIGEVIPENNLERIFELIKDKDSPESHFAFRILFWLVIFNIFLLWWASFVIFFLSRKIISPIKIATQDIQKLQPGKENSLIHYPQKDEVGLLIASINALNKRLSVQEKIRSRLLADISHELKTPITAIRCYIEGIADGIIDMSESNLDSILSEMNRLVELVDQIMEYEKFENSDLQLQKTSQNPYEIISVVATTIESSLLENKQKIILEWSRNLEVFLDSAQFTQIVYNLIGNFKRYAGVWTTLTIDVKAKGITFSDNGKWVKKKELEFIFDKFYQGKKEKTGDIKQRWIGVGLSVVKKIIELHGWTIKVSSDSWKWFTFQILF